MKRERGLTLHKIIKKQKDLGCTPNPSAFFIHQYLLHLIFISDASVHIYSYSRFIKKTNEPAF